MEQLNELFAIPQNATQRAIIGGDSPLYGSATLDFKFISAMKQTPIAQPIWKNVIKLIKKKVIVPGYLTKGYFSFFVNKIFSPHKESDTLGMFSPDSKKVYILVDNWSNMFGAAPDSSIARTLIHELVHLFSYTRPSEFLSMFKPELLEFYTNFFKFYFDTKTDPSPKDVEKLIHKIYKDFEITTEQSISLVSCRELMTKIFMNNTNFDENTFERKVAYYFIAIKLLFTDFKTLKSLYENTLIDIPRALYKSYVVTFNIKPNGTKIIQEIVYPSEVICVIASHGSKGDLTKIYSAISKL